MALIKANITWSVKQVYKMNNNGRFKFDNIYQRSLVWELARKSGLIHSLIEGYPVPPFFARRIDGKIYDFLDGKQRINAICEFMDNEYYLTNIPDVTYINAEGDEVTETLEGKYFDELPEELQDEINDYSLTIYYYEDITPDQVRTLFCKLNSGKPLSTKEKNIANCVDINNVTEIGNHDLFKTIMTAKGLEKRNQIPMIMKIWAMLNIDIDDVSFESRDFNNIVQDTKMAEDERYNVVAVLDKFLAIYNEVGEIEDRKLAKTIQRKMKSETHFVSLVPFIKQAIDDEIGDNLMADFMKELFGNGEVVSDDYAEACKGGSAKNVNIRRRNDEIQKVWDTFFYVDNIDNSADKVENEKEDHTDVDNVDNIDDNSEENTAVEEDSEEELPFGSY